jgi:hypothetical protein
MTPSSPAPPETIDAKLAVTSTLAAVAVVGLFFLALKHAGNANKSR